MVISVDQGKVTYAPVPKAGCSSVKAMLAGMDPQVTLPSAQDITTQTYHAIYQTRRFRRDAFDRHKDGFRFTVVRDPIKRLMSVYTNRVVALGDLHKSRKLQRRGTLPMDPDPDFFFQNLPQYMRLSSLVRHHALPAVLFTGPDLAIYDRVFRTQEMDQVAAALSELNGTAITATRANKSEMSLPFDTLAPQTRAALHPFLMDEYAHLVAYFDNPLT